MKASNLELYNFRNYEYENISFSDGVNIIHGENGMGKTNILEAVYYFSSKIKLTTLRKAPLF